MNSHIKFGYLDLYEITNKELYELQSKVEEEINRRKRVKYLELIKEFKASFMDVNDEFIIKLNNSVHCDSLAFSDLTFIDRETGENIIID